MNAANDSMSNVVALAQEQESPLSPRRSLGSFFAWVIWIISIIFVLFQFFLQLSSGVMVAGLMKSFSLTPLGGGLLASAYYYIYLLFQVPAGFLVDHYGSRRVLSLGAAVCGLGCGMFALASHLSLALMGRLLMGAGASFAFVGSMHLASRWFPLSRFGFMAAMAEALGMMGSLFGTYFLAHLVLSYGWRHSMEGAALLSFIIAALLVLIVRNAPHPIQPRVPRTQAALWSDIKLLVKKPMIWINGLYAAATFAVITVFVALWGIPFIQKAYHLALSRATLLCNLVFVGVALGAPLLGWLDGRIRSRKLLMASSAFLVTLVLLVLIFDTSLSLIVVIGLMVLLGVFTSSYVLNFVIANEVSTDYTRSTAIGFTNMCSVVSAPILQLLMGFMLYLLSGSTHHTHFSTYSIAHFQWALATLPIFIALAGILGFWLPNRRT